MFEVSEARFEELVEQALDQIPDAVMAKIRNVAFFVDESNPVHPHILGLYEGVALTERTNDFSGFIPDTITIYRRPLMEFCDSEEELIEQVRVTVMHEIGHYFGLDEDDLERLGYH